LGLKSGTLKAIQGYNRVMMLIQRLLCLALVLCLVPSQAAFASTVETARTAAGTSGNAALNADLDAAKAGSGSVFDTRVAQAGLSTAVVPRSFEPTQRHPSADLIVGTPGKVRPREPKTPLKADGTAKEQKSGSNVWWALGGAAAGAGIGFLVGGIVGAAVGAVIGGVLGYFFGP